MARLSAQPLDMSKGVPCPLCPETLCSARQYQRHVGQHQEQLALFALPHLHVVDSEEDVEDDRSDESAASKTEMAPKPPVRDEDKPEPRIPLEVQTGTIEMSDLIDAINLLSNATEPAGLSRELLTSSLDLDRGKSIESLTGPNPTYVRLADSAKIISGNIVTLETARRIIEHETPTYSPQHGGRLWESVRMLRQVQESLGFLEVRLRNFGTKGEGVEQDVLTVMLAITIRAVELVDRMATRIFQFTADPSMGGGMMKRRQSDPLTEQQTKRKSTAEPELVKERVKRGEVKLKWICVSRRIPFAVAYSNFQLSACVQRWTTRHEVR